MVPGARDPCIIPDNREDFGTPLGKAHQLGKRLQAMAIDVGQDQPGEFQRVDGRMTGIEPAAPEERQVELPGVVGDERSVPDERTEPGPDRLPGLRLPDETIHRPVGLDLEHVTQRRRDYSVARAGGLEEYTSDLAPLDPHRPDLDDRVLGRVGASRLQVEGDVAAASDRGQLAQRVSGVDFVVRRVVDRRERFFSQVSEQRKSPRRHLSQPRTLPANAEQQFLGDGPPPPTPQRTLDLGDVGGPSDVLQYFDDLRIQSGRHAGSPLFEGRDQGDWHACPPDANGGLARSRESRHQGRGIVLDSRTGRNHHPGIRHELLRFLKKRLSKSFRSYAVVALRSRGVAWLDPLR